MVDNIKTSTKTQFLVGFALLLCILGLIFFLSDEVNEVEELNESLTPVLNETVETLEEAVEELKNVTEELSNITEEVKEPVLNETVEKV